MGRDAVVSCVCPGSNTDPLPLHQSGKSINTGVGDGPGSSVDIDGESLYPIGAEVGREDSTQQSLHKRVILPIAQLKVDTTGSFGAYLHSIGYLTGSIDLRRRLGLNGISQRFPSHPEV